MARVSQTDLDGPEQYHVILVDNGRTALSGTSHQAMLRCIRCAACLNHCPVYAAIGGHAYDSTYPGPMGAVLSPHLFGLKNHRIYPMLPLSVAAVKPSAQCRFH